MDYKNILINKIKSSPKGWFRWLKGQKEILMVLEKEPLDLSLCEKVYWYINDITEYPKCNVCGREVKSFKGITQGGYRIHCSSSCAQKDETTRKKLEETSLKIYGTKNPAQSKKVQNKMKNTCKKRYGAENIFASEIGKQKIKDTNIKKYGCENPQQNKDIKIKTKNTLIKVYGVTCGYLTKKNYKVSKGELELYDFIKSLYKDAKHTDRKQIWPMELDIYIPSKKIGIEYDGEYWHNLPDMIKRDKEKDKICQEKNIILIRVKESDWIKNRDNEKLRIMEALNG